MRRHVIGSNFCRLLSVIVAGLCALFSLIAAASANEAEFQGSSYLKPFPNEEVYRVAIIGDDLAEALHAGLSEQVRDDPRLRLAPRHMLLNGLMRPDNAQKLAQLEDDLKRDPPDIAIVMLGAWDRVSLRDQEGRRVPVGSPEWRKVYGNRAERLLKMLKRLNSAVYLVGLPNLRRWDANEDVQMMNETLRERAYLNSMKFIDSYAGFLDDSGGFSAWGPDLSGKIVRLRDNDGVYFTTAGRLKLAHFVERELRRDVKHAQAERVVPLAGAEDEQAKINPGKAVMKGWDAQTDGSTRTPEANPTAAPAGVRDQPADNGRIQLSTVNSSGREELVTIEIVRPAIPASVVALVTRKESPDKPSQMGEVLVDRIPGGLDVMSTVTPPVTGRAGPTRAMVSPTQTPYYRALVKGERLQPRPGRIDDMSWPRPDPGHISPMPATLRTEPDKTLETGSSDATEPASKPTHRAPKSFQR